MTTGTPLSSTDPMQALERFIVDNDDLFELDEHVGQFNIFDALGITHAEIRHSNFLSWLLDPAESHGRGPLFLNAILMDLFKKARGDGMDVPLSPVELDGAELRGVDIRREWHNIDILIKCDEPRFVIAIENKIDAGEHSDQLARYRKNLKQHFDGWPTLCVFLTREGDEPSDDSWCVYSYADLHRVLSRVRKMQEKSIGEDVRTFLDHYLNLIESRFMSDPKIDELCQRIYKNHKQAIDLIIENISTPQRDLFESIKQLVRDDPNRWKILRDAPKSMVFIPPSILELLPPVGTWFNPETAWIVTYLSLEKEAIVGCVYVSPTKDEQLWKRVVDRLTTDPGEFRFEMKRKSRKSQWITLVKRMLGKWPDGQTPKDNDVKPHAKQFLDDIQNRTSSMVEALRPIIAQWKPQ